MRGRICVVEGCARTPPRGQRICGRCWALVPAETKLALHDQGGVYGRPEPWAGDMDADEFRNFVGWSWWRTLDLAARQAAEEREVREITRWAVENGQEVTTP